MARTRPARSRKAPQRYEPEGGPLDDDYAADQHDDVALEDLSESDVTSIATFDDTDDDGAGDLEGFVVDDSAPIEHEADDDDGEEEDEWDSCDDDEEDPEEELDEGPEDDEEEEEEEDEDQDDQDEEDEEEESGSEYEPGTDEDGEDGDD